MGDHWTMQRTVGARQFFPSTPWCKHIRHPLPFIHLEIRQILGSFYRHVLNSFSQKLHGNIISGCKVVKRWYSKKSMSTELRWLCNFVDRNDVWNDIENQRYTFASRWFFLETASPGVSICSKRSWNIQTTFPYRITHRLKGIKSV